MMMCVTWQSDGILAGTGNGSMLDRTGLLTPWNKESVLATMIEQHGRSCILQLSVELDKGSARAHLHVRLDTRWNKKLLTFWEVKSQIRGQSVGSGFFCSDTSFVDETAREMKNS